jgi:hypothetical protein
MISQIDPKSDGSVKRSRLPVKWLNLPEYHARNPFPERWWRSAVIAMTFAPPPPLPPPPEDGNGSRDFSSSDFSSKEEAGATSSWLKLPASMMSSATETKTDPTTCGEVLAGIRSGKWEKLVRRVRDGYAKAFETAVEEGKSNPPQ